MREAKSDNCEGLLLRGRSIFPFKFHRTLTSIDNRHSIDTSIRLYDKLLLILSEASVASQWVEHEVETAIGKELEGRTNVLFPVRLDDVVMQSKIGWASHIKLTRHITDFSQWKHHDAYQKSLGRLLRDLKSDTAQQEIQ